MKVLVLCDDAWHLAEVIKRGLRDFGDGEFLFDFVYDAKDILTPEMLKEYPVIMNCKGNALTSGNPAPWFEEGVTEVGVRELEQYVREGGGFLSVHAGNTARKEEKNGYVEFVGNSFVTHPPRCEVAIKVTAEHPVTQGVEDFTIRDEHYQLADIAKDAEILLQSVSAAGGTQIAGYVREMGDGRICALTPGHILAVWQNEMFRKLLKNALWWCAAKEPKT